MATLDEIDLGRAVRVLDITDQGALTQRIMALGVMPGHSVRIVGIAPMGDPITIEGPNGRVSLRRREAAAVVVEGME